MSEKDIRKVEATAISQAQAGETLELLETAKTLAERCIALERELSQIKKHPVYSRVRRLEEKNAELQRTVEADRQERYWEGL